MTKLVVITGQSNATGSNSGGANPASANVKVWDSSTSDWGSSDYTQYPMLATVPRGNGGNNNIGLSLAHRLHDETGEDVYVVMYASGGKSISNWDTVNGGTFMTALDDKVTDAVLSPELSNISFDDVIVVWAQGEADAAMSFADYTSAFQRVIAEMRATTWCNSTTPILVMEPSMAHIADQASAAKFQFCRDIDGFCTLVSSAWYPTSDGYHFTGQALHEIGYKSCYNAYKATPDFKPVRPEYVLSDGLTINTLITPRQTATPVSDEIVIAGGGFYAVYGEGGAADTVSKITKASGSWSNGTHIWLRAASSGQPITLSEVTGGNLKLTSSVTLNSNRKLIHLMYDSGVGGFITDVNT